MDKHEKNKKKCTCNHSTKETTPEDVRMLALLPCGLRNAFIQTLQTKFPEIADNEQYIIDGNLNYEKSFYEQLDTIDGFNAIPDIFISADINNLYHKSFIDKFLNDDYFERIQISAPELFVKQGFIHPTEQMCWFTANLLVIVADTEKIHEDLLPVSWKDLLYPLFERAVTLRGDDDFFCNAVLFPFLKSYGADSVTVLGQNTAKGLHPSQMVKIINAGNEHGTPLYVMPYSFAMKIRDKVRFRTLFTNEGPIVSPVQLMVKKGAYERNKSLIDFILGVDMSDTLIRSGFPALKAQSEMSEVKMLNWIGWDFVCTNDISECKDHLQDYFYKGFKRVD